MSCAEDILHACEYSSALDDTMYTSLSECIPENWYIDFLTSIQMHKSLNNTS